MHTRVLRPPGLCQDTAMDTLLPRQPPEPQRVSLLPLGLGAFLASPAYLTGPAQQACRLFNLLGSLVRNVPIQMCATPGRGPAGGEERGWGRFLRPKAILPVSSGFPQPSHSAPSQIFESSLLERNLGLFSLRKRSGPWKGRGGACFPVVVGEMVPSEQAWSRTPAPAQGAGAGRRMSDLKPRARLSSFPRPGTRGSRTTISGFVPHVALISESREDGYRGRTVRTGGSPPPRPDPSPSRGGRSLFRGFSSSKPSSSFSGSMSSACVIQSR